MSILKKLAFGSIAALALFGSKRKATAGREVSDAREPAADKPAKPARRKAARRRAPVRRVKPA